MVSARYTDEGSAVVFGRVLGHAEGALRLPDGASKLPPGHPASPPPPPRAAHPPRSRPADCPPAAAALVNELVRPDPVRRLPVQGVRAHPFFGGFDWGALGARAMRAPIPPKLAHALDTRCFEEYGEEGGGVLGAAGAAPPQLGGGDPAVRGSGASLLIGGRPWDEDF